ncbi:hypothetical protein ACQPZQ_14755 [Pseudonocardia sp. CA-142604]|uniref:hypothetical protein n=1 Tax=Pseudonocardia sp. CA-142604 TaxID=3240024 RepID=UPI003D8C69C4
MTVNPNDAAVLDEPKAVSVKLIRRPNEKSIDISVDNNKGPRSRANWIFDGSLRELLFQLDVCSGGGCYLRDATADLYYVDT